MLGYTIVLLSAGLLVSAQNSSFDQDRDWIKAKDVYQFHAKDILGNDVSLEKYRGHIMIIVNVASNCGLTNMNYEQLVQLHEKYSESKGLRILAFPSNQFGQERGTSQEIMNFVKGYNVKFDMFEKIYINGEDAHPLFKWLKDQQRGFITDGIKWNFTKFIIDRQGKAIAREGPISNLEKLSEYIEKN